MGILDSVIGAITSPTGIGAAITGGLGLLGAKQQQDTALQQQQNAQQFSAEQVAQQEEFQTGQVLQQEQYGEIERQRQQATYEAERSTAYQTAVQDMEKAGLNPMLAYSQGGAPTAMGSSPTASAASGASANGYMAPAVNRLGAAISSAAAITNIDAIAAKAERDRAEAAAKTEELPVIRGQVGLQDQQVAKLREEAEQLSRQHELTFAETMLVRQQINNAIKTGENIDADTGRLKATTDNTRVNTVLGQLEIPQARNIANVQGSWWSRNVAPYLPDILKSTSSAASIRGLMR